MARYRKTLRSPRPAEDVFAYMADFSNVSDWDPSLVRASRLDQGEVREGSRFSIVVETMGRETELLYEVTAIEPPRRVVVRAETRAIVSEDTITVAPRPAGGSEMTYDADLRLKGGLKLLEPAAGFFFRRNSERAAERLGRELAAD